MGSPPLRRPPHKEVHSDATCTARHPRRRALRPFLLAGPAAAAAQAETPGAGTRRPARRRHELPGLRVRVAHWRLARWAAAAAARAAVLHARGCRDGDLHTVVRLDGKHQHRQQCVLRSTSPATGAAYRRRDRGESPAPIFPLSSGGNHRCSIHPPLFSVAVAACKLLC